jgi:hypothetical protein
MVVELGRKLTVKSDGSCSEEHNLVSDRAIVTYFEFLNSGDISDWAWKETGSSGGVIHVHFSEAGLHHRAGTSFLARSTPFHPLFEVEGWSSAG